MKSPTYEEDFQKRPKTPFRLYSIGNKQRKPNKKKIFAKVDQMDGTPGQVGTIPDDLVGEPNECPVMVNGISTLGLLDSGSIVLTIRYHFWMEHFPDSPIKPLDDLLTVTGAGGSQIPYHGYVEVDIKLPGSEASPFPFLVVGDTDYNSRVLVLIGTNVLWKDSGIIYTGNNMWSAGYTCFSLSLWHQEKVGGHKGNWRLIPFLSSKQLWSLEWASTPEVELKLCPQWLLLSSRVMWWNSMFWIAAPGMLIFQEKAWWPISCRSRC